MNELALTYFHEAYRHQMAGNLDQAVDLYRKSIAIHPTAEAHTFLGWTYSFQGLVDNAIAECKRAIAVDPDFGNPYNDIGAYLIEQGKVDEAIPWLEKAIAARRYDPRHFPHYNLGRAYAAQGKYFEAVRALERALVLYPAYELARRDLGKLLARLN